MDNDPLQTLSEIIFFKGLKEDQLQALRTIVRVTRFEKGEIIFQEGDEATGFYSVVSGKVKIFKTSLGGREQTLHIFGPKDPFGEVAVFTGKHFPAFAQALEASTCLFIPKRGFLDLIKKYPEIALNILALLSQRLRRFTRQVESLSLKEVPERLAGYILYLHKRDEKDTVKLDITKGELANLLGTIPETLSRVLAKFSKENILSLQGSHISILDLDRLALVVEGEERL